MTDDLLSITEVGRATGLQSSALRYYERAGLLKPAARIAGRRHYSPEVLQRLAVIALLQEAGFTIKEVSAIIRRGGSKDRWRAMAKGKLDEIDAHMQRVNEARELLVSALACSCTSLESCDLVTSRRGRHRKAIRTLSVGMGPPE